MKEFHFCLSFVDEKIGLEICIFLCLPTKLNIQVVCSPARQRQDPLPFPPDTSAKSFSQVYNQSICFFWQKLSQDERDWGDAVTICKTTRNAPWFSCIICRKTRKFCCSFELERHFFVRLSRKWISFLSSFSSFPFTCSIKINFSQVDNSISERDPQSAQSKLNFVTLFWVLTRECDAMLFLLRIAYLLWHLAAWA